MSGAELKVSGPSPQTAAQRGLQGAPGYLFVPATQVKAAPYFSLAHFSTGNVGHMTACFFVVLIFTHTMGQNERLRGIVSIPVQPDAIWYQHRLYCGPESSLPSK